MSLETLISSLDKMLKVPSVIGHEEPFVNYLSKLFLNIGFDVEIDDQNRFLAVKKKGEISNLVLTVHIDRHGIAVNKEGKFEYAAYLKKKENVRFKANLKKMNDIGARFLEEPVYAYNSKGTILGEGIISGYSVDFSSSEILFQIKGIKKLPYGTAISYKSELNRENGKISSQIDNAISVAAAYELSKEGFDGTIVFSPDEEIGKSGLYIMAYLALSNKKNPRIITLDTSPYNHMAVISNGTVLLRYRDEQGKFKKNLTKSAVKACESLGIPYLILDKELSKHKKSNEKTYIYYGDTELGKLVSRSLGTFNGMTLQIPTSGYHTNHETTSLASIKNWYKLIKEMTR